MAVVEVVGLGTGVVFPRFYEIKATSMGLLFSIFSEYLRTKGESFDSP